MNGVERKGGLLCGIMRGGDDLHIAFDEWLVINGRGRGKNIHGKVKWHEKRQQEEDAMRTGKPNSR
jgi:hypothetical protein